MVYGTTFPKHQTFAYRQPGISLEISPYGPPMSPVWALVCFSTAVYCGAAPMILRLSARADIGPGAFLLEVRPVTLLNVCFTHMGPGRIVAIQLMVASAWPLPPITKCL